MRPTDGPKRERGERERGDRGSFLHNVSGYWRAGSEPACLPGYESRLRQTHAGAAAAINSRCVPPLVPLLLYPLPSLRSVPSLGLTDRAP